MDVISAIGIVLFGCFTSAPVTELIVGEPTTSADTTSVWETLRTNQSWQCNRNRWIRRSRLWRPSRLRRIHKEKILHGQRQFFLLVTHLNSSFRNPLQQKPTARTRPYIYAWEFIAAFRALSRFPPLVIPSNTENRTIDTLTPVSTLFNTIDSRRP